MGHTNTAISILILDPEDGQTITSEPRNHKGLEILKSIAYGGLTESVTSLGVVTSAASADATTLNILALALANLVGGLFIIAHNIRELRKEQQRESNTDPTNERYRELLGKRKNFILHTTVAILSFLVFGSVAPVVYGSSFRKSDNKEYKLAAVTAASLFCIIILAICKAYARKSLPKNYIKIVMYYAVVGFAVSGVSYLSGQLIRKLLENFALFKSEKPAAWAS
ncbi:membrane protein of ER body-like protein [Mercurialis annua]|uniref:membrane protein of ER body-like protein n=1 Tax=Mercurialis annua TaxID=3986 RepID=UPI00215DEFB4|nr:membrane protein of ER body-like protein [Mercurialis annua]